MLGYGTRAVGLSGHAWQRVCCVATGSNSFRGTAGDLGFVEHVRTPVLCENVPDGPVDRMDSGVFASFFHSSSVARNRSRRFLQSQLLPRRFYFVILSSFASYLDMPPLPPRSSGFARRRSHFSKQGVKMQLQENDSEMMMTIRTAPWLHVSLLDPLAGLQIVRSIPSTPSTSQYRRPFC